MSKERQLKKLPMLWETAASKFRDAFSEEALEGEGSTDAPLVILGEHPSKQDLRAKRVFSDEFGDLVKEAMMAGGLRKRDVYLTNVVKYAPLAKDRSLAWDEYMAFRLSLCRELEILQPKLILCLGGSAFRILIGKVDMTVEANLGKTFTVKWLPSSTIAVTYHPKYVSRTGGFKGRNYAHTVEDFRWAKKFISNP